MATNTKPAAKTKKARSLIVGATAIGKAIDSIGRRGNMLDADIQLAGLSIISHIEQHGDTTLADRLYGAMPKGSRRNALASWMLDHGKLRLPVEGEKMSEGRVFCHDKTKRTDMEGASAVQWTEYRHKDGPVTGAFDAAAAFSRLVKSIESARKAGRKIEGLDEVKKLAGLLASAPATE